MNPPNTSSARRLGGRRYRCPFAGVLSSIFPAAHQEREIRHRTRRSDAGDDRPPVGFAWAAETIHQMEAAEFLPGSGRMEATLDRAQPHLSVCRGWHFLAPLSHAPK